MSFKGVDWTAAAALAGYMALLLGIGFWAARRATASQEEFLLGGRALGPLVAGLAYAATSSSAWVLLGFTAFVANAGLSALWMVPGILAGYALVWLWLGPHLGEASRREGYLTAIDFLAGGSSPLRAAIRITGALMILFCFSFYVAAQFDGAGAALSGVFPIGKTAAVLLGAGVILAYTFLGGFWAVALTDTLQGLAILFIALALPVAAFGTVGGWSGLAAGLSAQTEAFTSPFGAHAGWSAVGLVIGLGATGFGALGQPHLVTWVMAARDPKARVVGAAIAVGWGALVYSGMAVIALAARAAAGPEATVAEGVIFDIARQAAPGFLPVLATAAILSAIMSTVDAQLLVASAAASHDLGLSKLAPHRAVVVTRGVIVALCAAAVAVTLLLPASIFSRVLFAWTALGAAFGPSLVAICVGRRPQPAAVLLAIFAGFALAVWFNQFASSGPGQWKERIIPWLAGLLIVFAFPSRSGARS